MNDVCVKTLDCTLRDGGYINDWKFSYKTAREITESLITANVEIIEVGFLDHDVDESFEGTKFRDTDQIREVVPGEKSSKSKLVAMIMLGKFLADEIPDREDCILDGIRICFKKEQLSEAVILAKEVARKGYEVFIQPASITDYTNEDIDRLLTEVNKLNPSAVYIVDTYGLMDKDEVVDIFTKFDKGLSRDVSIGFHSHNNLQLSFANSQELIEINDNRTLIIDACVFGMGRGAGNLCTELITKTINERFGRRYDLLKIMDVVDKYINPLFKIYSWGYSVPYYIAAIAKCHPSYATFLADKHSLGVNAIHSILISIPEEKKRNYDEKLIKQLYVSYQEKEIDDTDALAELAAKIGDKKVLLLAPGSSLNREAEAIASFIEAEKPYCISVNFVAEMYDVNSAFFCNKRRYEDQKSLFNSKADIVITSNIDENVAANVKVVNYNTLINPNFENPDISGAVVLRLLVNLGVKEVFLAGFDGFSVDNKESFFDESLYIGVDSEANKSRNEAFEEQLKIIAKQLDINFITKTAYRI